MATTKFENFVNSLNEKDDAGTHLDKLEAAVSNAKDFFAIGKELDKDGYKGKYFYSDTMVPMYQVEIDGFKFGILNKKYVDKGDREVGSTAIGLMESLVSESVTKDVYTLRDAGFDAKTRGNSILVSGLDIPGEKDTVIWWVPGRTPILPNYGKSYNEKCDTVEDLLDLLNNLEETRGVWESKEVNEERISYPRGKQYRVSARFMDRDDQATFAETYGLGKQSSNYARAFANEEELVEIVKDLKNVYGLENKAITLHIKGKNGDWDFWKIDSQNLRRHLSSDLLSKLSEYVSESVVTEGKVTLKRRYTENHPAITAGQHAKIRNTVLEAIADGTITKEEFDRIVKEMSSDSGRWVRRNSKYFNVSEDGVSLSKFGRRVFNTINVSEEVIEEGRKFVAAAKKAKEEGKTEFEFEGKTYPVTIKENKTNTKMKETFLHESFSSFVESLSLNEAFKSSLLASLFSGGRNGKFDSDLAKAFYGTAKIKMDLVEDEDLLVMDPQKAYKNKQADTIIFYISDTPKENPYAPSDAWYDHKTIPGEGYLLAVASGENSFYTKSWGSRYSSDRTRKLVTTDNNTSDSVGISKKYKGWDGTGLYNVKRIAEVADRAIVLNMALLRQKYSSVEQRNQREAAKKGAIAFKSDKDFKSENMKRYQEILANKAAALPLDKMVADAIETLTNQIKDGLAKGEKGQYGDVIIGRKANGSEAKMRDAANHMSNILDDYNRYVSYIAQAEESEKRYGDRESYYERESKTYAKYVKDKINQIESFDYVW